MTKRKFWFQISRYEAPYPPPENENGIGVFHKWFIISHLALRFFLCSPYSPCYFLKREKMDPEKAREGQKAIHYTDR